MPPWPPAVADVPPAADAEPVQSAARPARASAAPPTHAVPRVADTSRVPELALPQAAAPATVATPAPSAPRPVPALHDEEPTAQSPTRAVVPEPAHLDQVTPRPSAIIEPAPTPTAPAPAAVVPAPVPAIAEPRPAWLEPPSAIVVAPPLPARRDVHVRIGAVEVRAEAPTAAAQSSVARSRPAVRGFDEYRAVRSHAGWEI